MKTFKLNDKGFSCPESWQELTIEQILKLKAGSNRTLETIIICTGAPEEEWNKSTDFLLMEEIGQTLSFTNYAFNVEGELKEFVFKGVAMPPISDIGTKSTAQFQDLTDEVHAFNKEEGEEIDFERRLWLFPRIVAIYLQPYITGGEYDYLKAEEISKELQKHSAMEVCLWGNFFIQRFIGSRHGIMKDVLKTIMKQKKQRRGFLSYLRALVGIQPSTASRMETLKVKIT